MIWIKIFALFVFWFGFGFLLLVSAALMGGAPDSDSAKVLKYTAMVAFVPLILFYIYRAVRFYFFQGENLFITSDLIWYVIPTVLVAYFVYSSK